jgi:hypothetical protein
MHRERRRCDRLAMHPKAQILRGNRVLEVRAGNLSMNGVFVPAVGPMDVNEVVAFTMCQTLVSVKAEVVRVTAQGTGLRFESTLLD